MAEPPGRPGHWVLVDAHAHIHRCFDRTGFLDAAERNFRRAATRLGIGVPFDAVLALTEGADDDAFGDLWKLAGGVQPAGDEWRMERRADGISLRLSRGEQSLILVAGRQVAAREDLEVLMLGTTRRMADKGAIGDILRQARDWGAVRVIPWGAGKWFFARGRLLSALMREADRRDFFLGDEGGRPVFWPEPRHFADARGLGLRILPGTDPLPFPSETARAGSFGAAFPGRLDPDRPGASLLAALRDPATALTPFGALETPLRFVRHQVGMQLRKRRRAQTAGAA